MPREGDHLVSQDQRSVIEMTWPDPIAQALKRPGGARFYRCAFQVNPFAYFARHGQAPPSSDEKSYNEAIVQACKDEGIEVMAVTHHYRVKTAEALMDQLVTQGSSCFQRSRQ